MTVPVLTIDGPGGAGKGTVAQRVADSLGWHYLDSGAIYRILGYLAYRDGVEEADIEALLGLANNMIPVFKGGQVWLDGICIDEYIRTEEGGNRASRVAVIPQVRTALLDWQKRCARPPGLVADGRDMGTVVFPDASYKIYLTASAQERARRRFKQLKDKGFDANIRRLLDEIVQRDERDMNRDVSPLKPADDAVFLDTTSLDIDQVVDKVLNLVGVSRT